MRYYLVLFILLLVVTLPASAKVPTMLRIVDLRGTIGQPELENWLGSLQGVINRDQQAEPVYLLRNQHDDDMAQVLLAMYGLKKEVYTAGALLAEETPQLTGQVLYSAKQPWSRNVALTAAALANGKVIATADDLGLPTIFDLRDRWDNRRDAYRWAQQQYQTKADKSLLVLAPESGNMLADIISARGLLAVDYSTLQTDEKADLQQLIAQLPANSFILGDIDAPGKYLDAFWALTTMISASNSHFLQASNTANLSCYARFPISRPLYQGRVVGVSSASSSRNLVLIYDGGLASLNGSQSLDHAIGFLTNLMQDKALAGLPVGVEVPTAIADFAPPVYQFLIARQLQSSVEFVAAPNGEGWTLPMALPDASNFLQRSAQAAQKIDIRVASFFDVGDAAAYQTMITKAAGFAWSGSYIYPVAVDSLPDKKGRAPIIINNFTCQPGYSRARNPAELRSLLESLMRYNLPSQVIYLDPYGVTPSMLANMLPEITANFSLLTPSQAAQEWLENSYVSPWLDLKTKWGIKYAKRENPTLKVSTPKSVTTASAADAIPISVQITGRNQVLQARVIYITPDKRMRVAYMQNSGDNNWETTLPPALVGGKLSFSVEVVEQGGVIAAADPNTRPTFWGYGVTTTTPISIDIPVVDTDEDGAEDTLEIYQNSDPRNWDSDGDGLADGYDVDPTKINRDISLLFPAILPPIDLPFISDPGKSRLEFDARLLPAASSMTYHISLKDLPATVGSLRLQSVGKLSIQINNQPAQVIGAANIMSVNELPVTRELMLEKSLDIRLTALDTDCLCYSLRLTNNPEGPYFLPGSIALSPARPPAATPIRITAGVYSPNGIKAIRVNYGISLDALKTMDMALVEGSSGAVFLAEIPGMNNGDILIYNIEATDRKGNFSASPYNAEPIGLVGKMHSVALQGTRDLESGNWNASPIWGSTGRSLASGDGNDHYFFRSRPGKYNVWIQTQPRQRGINITVKKGNAKRLEYTIPAGSADGWYNAGTFSAAGYDKLDVNVTTVGETGFTAYGAIIFTQNNNFRPPLTHAGFDWYNSLLVSGISNGQTITGNVLLKVQPVGNIDEVRVLAKKRNAIPDKIKEFTRAADGRFLLRTFDLPAGEYDIIVTGVKNERDGREITPVPLVTVTLRVTLMK